MIKLTEKEFEVFTEVKESKGIKSSKGIQTRLTMDQSTCNKRLNKLMKLGFVTKVKEGKDIFWFPNVIIPDFEVKPRKPKRPVIPFTDTTFERPVIRASELEDTVIPPLTEIPKEQPVKIKIATKIVIINLIFTLLIIIVILNI